MTDRIEFDETDAFILKARSAAWDSREGPRVGDYVDMLDGTRRRFTHDWETDIQTTSRGSNDASFYLTAGGTLCYSGGLDPGIDKASLKDTGETAPAGIWFFHHGRSGAGRAVYNRITARVYRQTEPR